MATEIDLQNHELFKGHLSESRGGVLAVAEWLRSRGTHVMLSPSSVAKSYDKRMEAVDGGDIYMMLRAEVKHIKSKEFTCAEDWPFPDFIVCAKHAWDNATPKPFGIFYLNKSGTHIAFLSGDTSQHWTVAKRKDSRYQDYAQEFYFAPLKYVKFFKRGGND